MRRARFRLGLLLVAAGAAAGVTVGAAGAVAPAKTVVTTYEAFTSSGQIIPQVMYRSGYCVGGSYSSARRDAFRCYSGNYIYDPCFDSQRHVNIVVCPRFVVAGPIERDTGVAIRLTKPLADPNPPHQRLQPLVIETTSGEYFEFSGGATTGGSLGHDDVRLNYVDNPAEKAELWGFPDRASRLWTIPETRGRSTPVRLKASDRVAIRRVWI